MEAIFLERTIFTRLQLGWDVVDAGNAAAALQLEHMTLLFLKLVYAQGLGRNVAFALLRK